MRALGIGTNYRCPVPPQLTPEARDDEIRDIKAPAREQRHELKNQQMVLIGEALRLQRRRRPDA